MSRGGLDFVPEEPGARALRLAQQFLRVILQLFDLALLARSGIKGGAQLGWGTRPAGFSCLARDAQRIQEGQQRAV